MSERDPREVVSEQERMRDAAEELATVDETAQGGDEGPGDVDEDDTDESDADTETTDEEEVAAADAAASRAEAADEGSA